MFHPMRIRLHDADRDQYGADEWLTVSPAALMERRMLELRAWEKQTGVDTAVLLGPDEIPEELRRDTMRIGSVMAWLACKLAGLAVPDYADFDPRVWAMTIEVIRAADGGDVDPPSSSAATSVPAAKAKRSRQPRRG